MKKFAFNLERMLRYKTTLFDTERNALAALRAKRRAIEEKKESCEGQLAVLEAEFKQKAAKGLGVGEISRYTCVKENAEKLVEQCEEEMAALDIEIEKQLEVVMKLDKDVKGLEKMKEKQFEEYSAGLQREEQERISELVGGKYIEKQIEEQQEQTLRQAQAAQRRDAGPGTGPFAPGQ